MEEKLLRARIMAGERANHRWLALLLMCAALAPNADSVLPPHAPVSVMRLRGGASTHPSGHVAGGGGAAQLMRERERVGTGTRVEEVPPEEAKPNLKREESRLVLEEAHEEEVLAEEAAANETEVAAANQTTYRIDGVEVSEREYKQRVRSVAQRSLDDWIAQSDCGGVKAGDVLVPDMYESVPEAIAAVANNGTVYIRKGYYFWDGVLVVQKHMHVRGEPNPDEGVPGGTGRPTLEGRWLLGERSSGSFKHVNCIAKFSKEGQQEQHGKML